MATIRDIAKETGLSIATVSKCLNGKQVKAENKAAIDAAVKRLNYLRDGTARSMRTQSTRLVAIIVPTMKIVMIPEIVKFCSEALMAQNYYPIICVTQGDPEVEKKYILKCASHHIDGIISMPTCTDIDTYKTLDANNIPYVFFEQYVPDMPANTVHFSGHEAVEQMITAINSAGHLNGGVIFGNEHAQAFQSRLALLRTALERYGYRMPKDHVLFTDTTILDGCNAMKQLMALSDAPSVVFCMGEELTIGAYSAIRQSGLDIPGDVALIGMKNTHNFDFTAPLKITCLMQPNRELSYACVNRLLELINLKSEGGSIADSITHKFIDVKFIPGDTL